MELWILRIRWVEELLIKSTEWFRTVALFRVDSDLSQRGRGSSIPAGSQQA